MPSAAVLLIVKFVWDHVPEAAWDVAEAMLDRLLFKQEDPEAVLAAYEGKLISLGLDVAIARSELAMAQLEISLEREPRKVRDAVAATVTPGQLSEELSIPLVCAVELLDRYRVEPKL